MSNYEDDLRAAMLGSAWHEYTYPRITTEKPPERFVRAINVAAEVATARETALRAENERLTGEVAGLTRWTETGSQSIQRLARERDALRARIEAALEALLEGGQRPQDRAHGAYAALTDGLPTDSRGRINRAATQAPDTSEQEDHDA